jgi:hypothetical protein
MPRNTTNTIIVTCKAHQNLDKMLGHNDSIPRNERNGVQEGTFQSFIMPDQLPVTRISLFGAKRTCDIGRSSPICDPRLAYLCGQGKCQKKCKDSRNVYVAPLLPQKPFCEYQLSAQEASCCLSAAGRLAFELWIWK